MVSPVTTGGGASILRRDALCGCSIADPGFQSDLATLCCSCVKSILAGASLIGYMMRSLSSVRRTLLNLIISWVAPAGVALVGYTVKARCN
jgi:hypothetical protein